MDVQSGVALLFLYSYTLVSGESDAARSAHNHKSHSVEAHGKQPFMIHNATDPSDARLPNKCWPFMCSWLKKARSTLGEKYAMALQEMMEPLMVESDSMAGLKRALKIEDLSTRSDIRLLFTLPVSSLLFEYRRKMFELLTRTDKSPSAGKHTKKSRKRSRRSAGRSPRISRTKLDFDGLDDDGSPEPVDVLDIDKEADMLREAIDKIIVPEELALDPVQDRRDDEES